MQKGLKLGTQSVEAVPQEVPMRQFIYMSIDSQWTLADMAKYPGSRAISELSEDRLMLKTALGMASRGDVFIVQRFSDLGPTLVERKHIMDVAAAMGAQITSARSNQTISSYDDYVLLLEDVADAPKERKTKLSKADVEEIKRLNAQGMSQHKLAEKFNVAQPTIGRALSPKAPPKKSPKLPDLSGE